MNLTTIPTLPAMERFTSLDGAAAALAWLKTAHAVAFHARRSSPRPHVQSPPNRRRPERHNRHDEGHAKRVGNSAPLMIGEWWSGRGGREVWNGITLNRIMSVRQGTGSRLPGPPAVK
jgi:hypothetical protein